MPFGRLSPVSEADNESLYSRRAPSVDLRSRALNFSRPKPQDFPSSRNIHHDAHYAHSTSSSSSNAGGSIRGGIGSFYEPSSASDDPLDEPRFSLESERSTNTSVDSGLVWDPYIGELRAKSSSGGSRGSDFDAQRYAAPRRPPSTRSYSSSGSITADLEAPPLAELPGDRPSTGTSTATVQQEHYRPVSVHIHTQQQPQPQQQQQQPAPNPFSQVHIHTQYTPLQLHPEESTSQIFKRTSVDQKSERLSICSLRNDSTGALGWEDPAQRKGSTGTVGCDDSRSRISQRSLSDDNPRHRPSGDSAVTGATGAAVSATTSNPPQQPSFDVSVLGEKKLAKLRKKGINPELYMEMKAARGGKSKLVGPLVGNTFIG